MSQIKSVRIQTVAAKALAEWKAFFADQVAVEAKKLAQNSEQPTLITLHHYRQAAVLAAEALSARVQDEVKSDARRKAA